MQFLCLFAFCGAGSLRAETASVFVPAVANPQQAVALVYSPTGLSQRSATKMLPGKDGSVLVTFDYSKQDVRNGAFATVMVLNEDGSASFSNTVMLEQNEQGVSADFRAKLAQCSAQRLGEIRHNQQGLFESLIDIREKRVLNTRSQLEQIGNEQTIAKLRKLEQGFGFTYPQELSLSLPPAELAGRLDQLKHSIEAYQFYKSRNAAAESSSKK
ncbi:MAG: hypothetical protein KDD64_13465 [Bdellovibrionales bacterium]|nr:hypothetical protein [Bdellovibrionales bacterium]